MGVEYSTFRPITVAVCRQCRVLNFPGCKNHKQLLSAPFSVDGVSTRCPGSRCDVNTAKSRFPCVGCACKDHDIYRVTIADKELDRVVAAFKHRCGIKEPSSVKLATCLLICTECSASLFPIIDDKLCVSNSTGQIVDQAGQAVDMALWQNHFAHCHDKCPGKSRESLARIDVVLMFSELDYAKKKIKATGVGRWLDFKYTTGRVRSTSQHSSSAYPAASGAAPPPTSSSRPSSVGSLTAPVDLSQTHPVALGVCKKCMLVNFPGCARHRTLLTKPYEVIDRQGKTIYAGCPGEGCETNTRFANYVCAGCKGKDFSWYHLVLTDREADFLLKAWQGRGLGFSTNSKLAHSITICNLCLCTGFPGAGSKLCESRQGKLVSPVTGAPMDVARWKDSHAHIQGCPGVGRVDVLMRVDMVLHGPEVQYLVQNIHAAARGHWNPLFMQAGQYFDPAAPPAGAYPPPHQTSFPPPTTTSPAYPPQPYPFLGNSGAYAPYPTMPYSGYDPMAAPPQTAPYGAPGSGASPYPPSPYGGVPPYQQNVGGSGAFPTGAGYPPTPTSDPTAARHSVLPPPDASAYPYAAYAAASAQSPAPTSGHFTAPPPQPHVAGAASPYPYPYDPFSGSAATATTTATATAPSAPSAPPDDLSTNVQQLSLEKEQKEDESLCVICLCEKRDVIFYKCGHLAACHDCAQQLKKHQKGCPICRQPILDIVKVYNA